MFLLFYYYQFFCSICSFVQYIRNSLRTYAQISISIDDTKVVLNNGLKCFFSLFLPCVDHLVCQFSFLSPGKNVFCVFKASTYITIDRSIQLTSKWQTQSKHGGMQKHTFLVLNMSTITLTDFIRSIICLQNYTVSQTNSK